MKTKTQPKIIPRFRKKFCFNSDGEYELYDGLCASGVEQFILTEQSTLLQRVLEKLNNLKMPLSNQNSDIKYDKQARYWNKKLDDLKVEIEGLKS